MQLFFGMLIGAAICLLSFKYKFSKNYGRFKTCKNDCPYYHTAVDIVKSDIVFRQYLKDNPCTAEPEDGEEVSNE